MNKFLCILFFIAATFSLSAQNRVIKGKVLDGDYNNEPLIGAAIRVEFNSKDHPAAGTVTDIDGNFSIEVSPQAKGLYVSFVGYATQYAKLTADKNSYTVILHANANDIDEVVVTGYQNIERRKLTASVSTIGISEEKVGTIKNIDQALAGQVAGLSTVATSGAPGAPVKIRIRGTASMSGTQDPLWVLDGIPLEGTEVPSMEELSDVDNLYQTSIAGINPADIENITVLKDAAATAIYGARAANGVIVITTKKGKIGKPQISLSAKMTVNPRLSLDRLNLLDSEQKVGLELDLLSRGYHYRENKGSVSQLLTQYGQLDAYKAGGWAAISPEAQNAINNLRTINTDWNDALFRTVINQEYYLSLSGGTDKVNYYTSVGWYDEQGNVRGVENNRFNVTLKTDYRINKFLKLGASVYANQRKQETYLTDAASFTNPMYYSRLANPYQLIYDENGNYVYDVNVQGRGDDRLADYNVYEEQANTSNERVDRSVMAIFDGALRINEYFKISSQIGLQYDNYKQDRIALEESYAMRTEKLSHPRVSFPDGGMHKVNQGHTFQWTWKTLAEYKQTYRRYHDFEIMLGAELRRIDAETNYHVGYGYDPYTLNVETPFFESPELAEGFIMSSESFAENAYASFFATTSYTFKDRYTFGGSIRFDGSDIYGVAKEYRFLPLYSVSGLWRMKEENWLKDVKPINDLSLRLSYGIQGNIDKSTSPYLIGKYDYKTILPDNSEMVIQANSAPNPDLRWEKTQNVNAGFDFAVLDRAICLTFDYYYRKSTDLIGLRMLPLESGFTSTTINWASMENKGFEIGLSTRNIYTPNFTWTTNINIGINDNKVLRESVAENSTAPSREGYPVGAIFAYETAGLDSEGYPLYKTKDGRAVSAKEFFKLNEAGGIGLSPSETRALKTYMGSTDPKVSGGFINNFEYKNWSLNINFTFNFGAKVVVPPSYNPTAFDRGLNTNTDILNSWTPSNPNTHLPTLMNPGGTHSSEFNLYNENPSDSYYLLDIWVKKLNYMRCQSIRLAYRFDGDWMAKIGVKSASVSLEGRNLFVIAGDYTNYLDPETMGNPYATPLPKSVIFSLNVNF